MQKILASFLVLLFIVGCGYTPASKQARKVVGSRLFVEVTVSLEDPENAVLVKDALNEAVISRFNSKLVHKSDATTQLKVKFERVAFSPIQYDSNGYAVFYRAKVTLNISYMVNGKKIYLSDYYLLQSFQFHLQKLSPLEPITHFCNVKV